MGLIAMSERDLQRIEVLSKVIDGRMTLVSAAHVLELSTRQVRRLLERINTGGAASLRHKAIGRPSNNRISDSARDYAVTLVGERYADFCPTLAAEKLAERDGLRVSRETLRRWMVDAGLWLSAKLIRRRRFSLQAAAPAVEDATSPVHMAGGEEIQLRGPGATGLAHCAQLVTGPALQNRRRGVPGPSSGFSRPWLPRGSPVHRPPVSGQPCPSRSAAGT